MGAFIWGFFSLIGLVAFLFLFAIGFGWYSCLGLFLFWGLAGFLTQTTENYDAKHPNSDHKA